MMKNSNKTTLEMRKMVPELHEAIQGIIMRDWNNLLKEGIGKQSFNKGEWKFWLEYEDGQIIS